MKNIHDYWKYEHLSRHEENRRRQKLEEPKIFGLLIGEWFWGIIFGGALILLTSGHWYPFLFGYS